MNDKIIEEIEKDLNRKEQVIVKIFKKLFIKVYRKGMIDCFNYYNK